MKRILALLLLALGACLDVADGAPPMCESTADCGPGEECAEGICYGNPPPGPFAALVTPPAERTDLVAREILNLDIAGDGGFGAIALEDAVTYKGTLLGCQAPLMCEGASIDASIIVTRSASFNGGPTFSATFAADPAQGFNLRLPRTRNDELYTVTVVPGGRTSPESGTTAAQLVPPLRMRLALPESVANQTIELGGAAANHLVHGIIVTTGNTPVSQYRVVAIGHWEEDAPLTEVSTVDYTGSDGTFMLRLSADLVGEIRIVATPFNSVLRPTLSRGGVSPQQDTFDQTLTLPGDLGQTVPVEVPVNGVDSNGEIVPVAGARVLITGSVTVDRTTATITAEGTTDVSGNVVDLQLLDGAGLSKSYRLSIIPPASSILGVVLDEPFTIANRLAALRLPDRIAVRGVLRDFDGNPVKDVSVTAKPSLRFLWDLPQRLQDLLAAIPPATTVTPESGEFVVWVDRQLGDVRGTYDLAFETSSYVLPSFTHSEVAVPNDEEAEQIILADINLPDAAYVRGSVIDAQNQTVEGAEIKIYRMPPQQIALCTEVDYAPLSCPIPATLLGRGAADADGDLRVTLPRQ